MYSKSEIEKIAAEAIEGTDKFLVEVSVSASNKILVEMDSPQGVNVEDCREMSRFIEGKLDREKEDFELNVSSPGLSKPFRVFQQYAKNVGREVKVEQTDGSSLSGKLVGATEQEIRLTTESKEKVEGKKSKELVVREHLIPMNKIKQTKVIITFK